MGEGSGCEVGLLCDLSHSPDLGWSLLNPVLTEQRSLKKTRQIQRRGKATGARGAQDNLTSVFLFWRD